jgi:hypothetical protein
LAPVFVALDIPSVELYEIAQPFFPFGIGPEFHTRTEAVGLVCMLTTTALKCPYERQHVRREGLQTAVDPPLDGIFRAHNYLSSNLRVFPVIMDHIRITAKVQAASVVHGSKREIHVLGIPVP